MRRIALVAIVVVLAICGAASIPIIEARNAWSRGNDAEAMAIARRWSWLPFPLLDQKEVLNRAAAYAATDHVDKADAMLKSVDPKAPKYNILRAAIAERKAGAAPYVFDRTGRAIASRRDHSVIATNSDFAPLMNGGALTIGAQVDRLGVTATIDTTLDPFVQKAALEALGSYHGSIVAIDPRTNEILAIANSAPIANRALEKEYEPGSVIKVLTGLNALSIGTNVDAMFPYVCNGELTIDGRRFTDWVPQGHGKLNTIDDAMAVSCNIYFADLGLRLGPQRLESFMRSAGFDGQTDLGIFQVPLGRIVGRNFDNFETAFFAIGLEHEEINAIHLAMLASMVANRGVLTTPRLLRQRRSILGDVVSVAPQQGTTRIASAAAAERMIGAMQAVATEPRGTGHRAEVEGLTLAMKTGTAGERKNGLEALIMAFAPVDKPKIAFSVIAEDAGPAEFAGAKIAHDFLEKMKPRL
ncbi:MAG: penicillin-binding transpeptidase domain-containing protein [Acidobacteriota bacterium]|nr:penicillin-binding transpeptidase domain-containing protein [Acidobacteriota bacterium]